MTMRALCHFTRLASTKGLSLLAGLLVTAAQMASPAHAQDWPAAGRNIRLIVPSPGGSGTGDTIARIAAEEIGKRLKANFVIDNKPGANGNIGATAAAQAPGAAPAAVPAGARPCRSCPCPARR